MIIGVDALSSKYYMNLLQSFDCLKPDNAAQVCVGYKSDPFMYTCCPDTEKGRKCMDYPLGTLKSRYDCFLSETTLDTFMITQHGTESICGIQTLHISGDESIDAKVEINLSNVAANTLCSWEIQNPELKTYNFNVASADEVHLLIKNGDSNVLYDATQTEYEYASEQLKIWIWAKSETNLLSLTGEVPVVVPDPEPVDPEPVDPEPVDPEPVDPEPVDPEPVDPEPVDPEPVDPEPVDPEPVDPEPVDPEPVDPEPVDPEPVDPEPVDPEPVDPEPVDPPVVDPPIDEEDPPTDPVPDP